MQHPCEQRSQERYKGSFAYSSKFSSCRMVHDTDIVELELRSKRFSLAVRKKEAIEAMEPQVVYQVWSQPPYHRSTHIVAFKRLTIGLRILSGAGSGPSLWDEYPCDALKGLVVRKPSGDAASATAAGGTAVRSPAVRSSAATSAAGASASQPPALSLLIQRQPPCPSCSGRCRGVLPSSARRPCRVTPGTVHSAAWKA